MSKVKSLFTRLFLISKKNELQKALDNLTNLTLYKIRTNNYKTNDSCSIMNIDQDGIKIERAIKKIKDETAVREDLEKELYDVRDYLKLCKTMNMPNKFIETVKQVINNIENGEINLIKDVENVKLIEKNNNCNFIVYNGDQCQSDQCKIEFDKIEFAFCYRKQDASDNQIKIEKSNLKEEIKEELRNLDCRVSILEEPAGLPDGQKIFVIKDIVKRMNLNSNGYYSTYYSAPFFYKNYKMSIRISFNVAINLNDEMIHGDYIGIFVVLMSHIYDAILKWPFSNKRGTISLLGGKKIKKSFITNDSVYFQRPIKGQMNPAFGFGRFIKKTDLLNYIVEDSLFIKCKIN
ncbi:TNF receptor-associated factor 3-like [Hydra vulgaris]|uniref:TNF receptor-associated factor 3-like n=1 Tax=Hydra vulgaris TaxID=6087 RepID=UPI0032E9FC57